MPKIISSIIIAIILLVLALAVLHTIVVEGRNDVLQFVLEGVFLSGSQIMFALFVHDCVEYSKEKGSNKKFNWEE